MTLTPSLIDLSDNARIMALYKRYFGDLNVNMGCALNHVVGPGRWINVDANHLCKPDLPCQSVDLHRMLPHESIDCIFASHFLEHLRGYEELFDTFDAFWRVLKPGGHVLAFVPHGASDTAWEDPFHCLRFSPTTFGYLCSQTYTTPGNAGYGADQGMPHHPWELIAQVQVPAKDYEGVPDASLEIKSRQLRNVIQEIHCVMRKAVA